MATQFDSSLEVLPTDLDMEMLSDRGHTDDIDIDIDVHGSYQGNDNEDIEFMLEDPDDNLDGQASHNDDIMLDDLEEETIVEEDMLDDDTAHHGHLPATEYHGGFTTASDISADQFLGDNPSAGEERHGANDGWHEISEDAHAEGANVEVSQNAPFDFGDDRLAENEDVDNSGAAGEPSMSKQEIAPTEIDSETVHGDKHGLQNLQYSDDKLLQQAIHSLDSNDTSDIAQNPTTVVSDFHILEKDGKQAEEDGAWEEGTENGSITVALGTNDHELHKADSGGQTASDEHEESIPQDGHENESLHSALSTYDEEDYPSPHPVIVGYQNAKISLFPPSTEDGTEEYLLQDSALAHKSISELFEACRQVLGSDINEEQALLMRIDVLDLSINEDSADCSTATMAQIIDIYVHLCHNDGIGEPQPLSIALTTSLRLSGRLTELLKASQDAMGLSSLQRSQRPLSHDESYDNSNEIRVEFDEHPDEGVSGDAALETTGTVIAIGEDEAGDLQHEENLKLEDFVTTDQPATEENDELPLDDQGGERDGDGNSGEGSDDDQPNDPSEEEARESLTIGDSNHTIVLEDAIAEESHDPDNLIDYSDDELEPSNETSRSSTIQGDRSNNRGHQHATDRFNDELRIRFPDGSSVASVGVPAISTSEGIGFSVPEDIDYFDEDNLSISEAYNEETSLAALDGGGYGTDEEQTLTSGNITFDPQDEQGVSLPTGLRDAPSTSEQPAVTGSPHASPGDDDVINEAVLEETSEQRFDHDDLEWTGLTRGEAPGENVTGANESYVDEFLDLDGLESDAEAPPASGNLTERGSPLGKRTWEEHAEDAANDESDQEVKRVKSR